MPDSADLFGPAVTAAVLRHMNDDHAADALLICRALGGRPAATAAAMSGMDAAGIVFTAQEPAGPVEVRIPWSGPVTERPQIRAEVVRMYAESRARLGLPGDDRAH
jgi:hypothetical protein